MKPRINKIKFGSITIDGEVYQHDVGLRLDGEVRKRNKHFSKSIYGTSHIVSADEARHIFEEGAKRLIVGAGKFGRVELSEEAAVFFSSKDCQVELLPNRAAIRTWNEAEGAVIGLFHVTC